MIDESMTPHLGGVFLSADLNERLYTLHVFK